ncbi:MAG: hypothetical protein WKG52_03835 [Variovorax sp.]
MAAADDDHIEFFGVQHEDGALARALRKGAPILIGGTLPFNAQGQASLLSF